MGTGPPGRRCELGETFGGDAMASVNPWATGAIEFVQAAANRRAATYRDRAAQLIEMATTEPITAIREKLRALAAQYEELAASLGDADSGVVGDGLGPSRVSPVARA